VKPEFSAEEKCRPGGFATTRWSLIVSGSNPRRQARKTRDAVSEVCRIYWRPVFAYICRRGYSPADAEDLTQDFFAMLLDENWLQHADRTRGRFRSLLLKSLDNFLTDGAAKRTARKRGGGASFVAWDDWMADAPSQLTISAEIFETWPAEKIFDLRWAATVVEQALRRLRQEYESRRRLQIFLALSGKLTAERNDLCYRNLANMLGLTESSVKSLLYHIRQRFRHFLREEVSRTVQSPDDVDAEIRYLCRALAVEQT
jgi:DNA-directed RNA polymerase specialized sigma24 family protein